ncbi:DUF4136 domain-containing protein [Tellurirhabdus rosea]|uniref:DUF4136 domain-containing protein n=1 Tax=Tellurirhabdus rosea TaxID=2674997 RepID=UPI00225B735A|nr:DUF4136 domain-containing protein [Tellurirhabdus rosea]
MNRKQLLQPLWLWAICLLAGLSACEREPLADLSPEDSQVFITNYDRNVNFGSYQTFSLPDSVLVLANNRQIASAITEEVQFLDQVSTSLTGRGFQRVNRNQRPDLGVIVARVDNQYTGVTTNPFYDPFFFGPGFGSGWGLGYGSGYGLGYGSPYQFYEVSDRYWIIEIVDLKNANQQTQQVNVLWTAEIRGNGIFDAASFARTINAVLEQSPYLRTAR